MSVKIGYLLPTRERIMDDEPSTARLIELAEKAETLGYDSLWVGDHCSLDLRHEPMTLLRAATRTNALNCTVLLPPLRNLSYSHTKPPPLINLSRRWIFGLGSPVIFKHPSGFEAAGVPFEKRVGRLLEGVKLCRALWRRRSQLGWLWSVKGATLGPTPARPVARYRSGGTSPGNKTRRTLLTVGFPTGPDDASEWGSLFRDPASPKTAA